MSSVETIDDLATAIGVALADDAHGEAEALRLAFGLVQAFDRSTSKQRTTMVTTRPRATGDARFDAMLAESGARIERIGARPGPRRGCAPTSS